GKIELIANRVYLLSPADVEVSAEDREKLAGGAFYNQFLRRPTLRAAPGQQVSTASLSPMLADTNPIARLLCLLLYVAWVLLLRRVILSWVEVLGGRAARPRYLELDGVPRGAAPIDRASAIGLRSADRRHRGRAQAAASYRAT